MKLRPVRFLFAVAIACLLPRSGVSADDLPLPAQGDYVVKDFPFASGQTLPELKLHYRTFGTPRRGAARSEHRNSRRVIAHPGSGWKSSSSPGQS